MSITYPYLSETEFPEKVDTMIRMSDLEIGDLSLLESYYSLYNRGDLSGAKQFLINNPQLNNKIFNAAKFNKLIDGIIATQQFFRDDVESVINDTRNNLQTEIDEFRYIGEYSASVSYKKKNIVTYLKCAYICRKDSKGQLPVFNGTSEYWGLLSVGIKGESGLGLSPRGTWDSSTLYYKDDFVVHNNKFWQSLNENINTEPSLGNSDWLLLMNFLPDIGVKWGDLKGW